MRSCKLTLSGFVACKVTSVDQVSSGQLFKTDASAVLILVLGWPNMQASGKVKGIWMYIHMHLHVHLVYKVSPLLTTRQ